jgi:DNA-directed RNA polymerase specialized sigma24 family protein
VARDAVARPPPNRTDRLSGGIDWRRMMSEENEDAQAKTAALVAAMEQVVAAMDPVTRDIFVLHRLDGWPYVRIARERGLSVAEVEQHIARAVGTLDRGLTRLGL